MKRGRDPRLSGLCDFIALSKPFWQASGAMLTAHFSHPSSGEVCPDLACYALLQKKDMKAGRETICTYEDKRRHFRRAWRSASMPLLVRTSPKLQRGSAPCGRLRWATPARSPDGSASPHTWVVLPPARCFSSQRHQWRPSSDSPAPSCWSRPPCNTLRRWMAAGEISRCRVEDTGC